MSKAPQDPDPDGIQGRLSFTVKGDIPPHTLERLLNRTHRSDRRSRTIALVLVIGGAIAISATIFGYGGTDIGVLGAVISLAGIALTGLITSGN